MSGRNIGTVHRAPHCPKFADERYPATSSQQRQLRNSVIVVASPSTLRPTRIVTNSNEAVVDKKSRRHVDRKHGRASRTTAANDSDHAAGAKLRQSTRHRVLVHF